MVMSLMTSSMEQLLVAVVEAVANFVVAASMQGVRFRMVRKDLDRFHMDDFGHHLKQNWSLRFIESVDSRIWPIDRKFRILEIFTFSNLSDGRILS